jgi:hypothetical protein
MFNNLQEAFERREARTGETSVYSRGICYMYGHLHDDKSKECFDLLFDKGDIYEEIKRVCEIELSGKVQILVRAYITQLIERKHDFRRGWKLIVYLMNYLKNSGAVSQIYIRKLNEIITKDYYSEKIKMIVREIKRSKKND